MNTTPITDITRLNRETIRVFKEIIGGKQNIKIPVILDNTGKPCDKLNVVDSYNLIEHRDFTDKNQVIARIFIQGHKQGCPICIFLLQRFGNEYFMMPHLVLTEEDRAFYPGKGGHRCPNLVRLDRSSRIEILEKLFFLCKKCLKPQAPGYPCNRTHYSRQECKNDKHQLLCGCETCKETVRRTEQKYNGVLEKYGVTLKLNSPDKKFIPNVPVLLVNKEQTWRRLEQPAPEGTTLRVTNCVSDVLQCHLETVCQGLKESEQFKGFGVDNISNEDKESFQQHLNQSGQVAFLSRNPILFHKDLNTPKPRQKTFNSIIKNSSVKFAPENICYFHINIKTNSGEIRAIWDSGSMRSVCLSSILKDQSYFYNQRSDQTSIEVVGGGRTTRQIHKTLIPLKHSSHRYLLTNILSVPKIVEDLPEHDMTEELQAAYFDYELDCREKGTTPIEQDLWPGFTRNGTVGGSIHFLIGCADLDFEIIFSWHGILFITHNIDSFSPVAFGGSYTPKINESTLNYTSQLANIREIDFHTYATRQNVLQFTSSNHCSLMWSNHSTNQTIRSKSSRELDESYINNDKPFGNLDIQTGSGICQYWEISTPKNIEKTYLPRMSEQTGNCLFLSIMSQLCGLERITFKDIIEKRRELRDLILKVGIRKIYGEGPITFNSVEKKEIILETEQEIESFLNSQGWLSYNLSFKEFRCVATIFNCSIQVHYITHNKGLPTYGMTPYYRFPKTNTTNQVEGAVVAEIIHIDKKSRPIFRTKGLALKTSQFTDIDSPIMDPGHWGSFHGGGLGQGTYYTPHSIAAITNPNTESRQPYVNVNEGHNHSPHGSDPQEYRGYDWSKQTMPLQQPNRETNYNTETNKMQPQFDTTGPYHYNITVPTRTTYYPGRYHYHINTQNLNTTKPTWNRLEIPNPYPYHNQRQAYYPPTEPPQYQNMTFPQMTNRQMEDSSIANVEAQTGNWRLPEHSMFSTGIGGQEPQNRANNSLEPPTYEDNRFSIPDHHQRMTNWEGLNQGVKQEEVANRKDFAAKIIHQRYQPLGPELTNYWGSFNQVQTEPTNSQRAGEPYQLAGDIHHRPQYGHTYPIEEQEMGNRCLTNTNTMSLQEQFEEAKRQDTEESSSSSAVGKRHKSERKSIIERLTVGKPTPPKSVQKELLHN